MAVYAHHAPPEWQVTACYGATLGQRLAPGEQLLATIPPQADRPVVILPAPSEP